MKRERRYWVYQVDAFTRTPFTGNPAGVVPDAKGLTDDEMQAIARELGNSETAFLLPPDGDDHDVRVRFFTPTTEVPSCGHATVAAHYVRAMERRLGATRVVQKIGAGILPVDVEIEGGEYRIVMTQKKPRFGPPLNADDMADLRAALGLTGGDALADLPVQIVDTGHPKLIVPLTDTATLHAVRPDLEALKRFRGTRGYSGVFLFTLAEPDEDVLTHARMFAPEIGIAEDPVTGNGNGPLGAYLVHHGVVSHDGRRLEFRSRQGEAMGRPGVVRVQVDIEDGEPTAVRVTGEAVVVFQGQLIMSSARPVVVAGDEI